MQNEHRKKNLLSVSVLIFGSAQFNRISKEKILASDSGLSVVCYIALFWIFPYYLCTTLTYVVCTLLNILTFQKQQQNWQQLS